MTIVPRSWARASASGSGSMPLDVTIAAQPSSIACSCASARSPTTTMSPASMLRPIVATSMEMTHSRPVIIVSPSPVTSSPWSTSTIVATCAGASANVGTPRDSRTYRRARSRSVTIPVSLPSSSTTGMRSMPCSAISRPTCADRVRAVGDDLELLHDVRHPQPDVGEELGLLRAAALEGPRGLRG